MNPVLTTQRGSMYSLFPDYVVVGFFPIKATVENNPRHLKYVWLNDNDSLMFWYKLLSHYCFTVWWLIFKTCHQYFIDLCCFEYTTMNHIFHVFRTLVWIIHVRSDSTTGHSPPVLSMFHRKGTHCSCCGNPPRVTIHILFLSHSNLSLLNVPWIACFSDSPCDIKIVWGNFYFLIIKYEKSKEPYISCKRSVQAATFRDQSATVVRTTPKTVLVTKGTDHGEFLSHFLQWRLGCGLGSPSLKKNTFFCLTETFTSLFFNLQEDCWFSLYLHRPQSVPSAVTHESP